MNDELLTLYYYDDGISDDERREIEAALNADADLRARYKALWRQLDRLKTDADEKAPQDMVARFHDTIDRAARLESQRAPDPAPSGGGFHFLSFAWGTAVAAVLVVGIGIGMYLSRDEAVVPVETFAGTVDTGTDPGSAAFARGLQVHLRQSNDDIAGLSFGNGTDQSLLIMHIIQQNRLFERVAEQNNSPELARVLRAFEPILIQLTADDITPEEADALRAQLAFELNVVLTKMGRVSSQETDTI